MQGDVITGLAVIREPMSTTFVPPGLTAAVGTAGEIVITREEG
jgi:N-methylhydantoinase A